MQVEPLEAPATGVERQDGRGDGEKKTLTGFTAGAAAATDYIADRACFATAEINRVRCAVEQMNATRADDGHRASGSRLQIFSCFLVLVQTVKRNGNTMLQKKSKSFFHLQHKLKFINQLENDGLVFTNTVLYDKIKIFHIIC